jgi:hypothetical protein
MVMTSAEEAGGPENKFTNIFRTLSWKGTDLQLIFVKSAKKSKVNPPYYVRVKKMSYNAIQYVYCMYQKIGLECSM